MKLFDRVAVICDYAPEMLGLAIAIRATLEGFNLGVDFYHLAQKRQVLEFFSRPPSTDYTIVVTHGDGGGQITFSVVDQVDGDYTKVEGWEEAKFALTPDTIPEFVKGQRGTLIVIACGGGKLPLASAFLAAGYDAYIGADAGYYDADAAVLFVASLFYHLRAEDRDYATRAYSLEEAVARAAGADADFVMGTQVFRCWRSADVDQLHSGMSPDDRTI